MFHFAKLASPCIDHVYSHGRYQTFGQGRVLDFGVFTQSGTFPLPANEHIFSRQAVAEYADNRLYVVSPLRPSEKRSENIA